MASVVLLFQCMGFLVFSQSESSYQKQSQWKIKHLTVDQGLSNNLVQSISEDRNGYIWIGTPFGLNRFDGINVKQFLHREGDATTLSSDYISSVAHDSDGGLWIGTDLKLYYYQDSLERFKEITMPGIEDGRRVHFIVEDQHKQMLVGTLSGLYKCDIRTLKCEKYEFGVPGFQDDAIYRMVIDKGNNFWFHIFNQGVFFYDSQRKKLKQIPDYDKYLPNGEVAVLYIDRLNTLWIGSQNHGLFKLNTQDSTLISMQINDNLYTKRVRTIFEDNRGRMFVGTRLGLFLYHEESGKFDWYAHDSHRRSRMSQNSVMCSYLDKTGNVWLGTHSGGINYINMFQKEFVHFPFIPDDDFSLNTRSVFCFAEMNDRVYVGTDHGINVLNKETGKFSYLVHDREDARSLSFNDIKSITIATPNRKWVATNGGGLNELNDKDIVVNVYKHDSKEPLSIPSNKVYQTYVDQKGRLWVISDHWRIDSRPVLSRLINEKGHFQHYMGDFTHVIHGAGDRFFVGGRNCFFIYDLNTERIEEVRDASLMSDVFTLYLDRNENLWIGSGLGLVKYSLKNRSFNKLSTQTRLGEVFGILDDGRNLWVSTNDGLIELLDIHQAEGEVEVRRFDQRDGLQSREFNENSFFKGADGNMYFGGDNGFNLFDPTAINDNPFKPKIEFSALKVEDQIIVPGQELDGKIILNKALKYAEEIKLPYQVPFNITFDALHFENAEDNQYKYRLEDVEKNWTYSTAYANSINYHNLAPGNYKLVVYAINSDGIVSDYPARLGIQILPPVWMTGWFKFLMLVAVMVLTVFYLKYRTRMLKRQKVFLKRQVDVRTEELRSERDQLEKTMDKLVESEKLAALGVFTAGVAHEINNPTNYISGATYGLFDIIGRLKAECGPNVDPEDWEELEDLEEVLKTGVKRITDIVDSLKNYTRADNNRFVNYNIITAIEDALMITENKIKKKITIYRNYPPEVYMECLPSRISQIMINLLDNAADAINDVGGSIHIKVSEESSRIVIRVKDTGEGISQENLKHLFDPFFTTKEVGKGTGLGLFVSHGYVIRHGGTLTVKSEEGLGSEFIIEFPVRQDESMSAGQKQGESQA